jgi:hypothetical protein
MTLINYFCHLQTGGNDVTCPKCHEQSDVEWDTETGEALSEDHEVRCPYCYAEFTIYVELNRPSYRVKQ